MNGKIMPEETRGTSEWYQKMRRTLQLCGKSEGTVQAYTRAVRQLSEHIRKDPESITEEELTEYFLHRRNVSRWAPKSLNLCFCAARFYYRTVLGREWKLLSIVHSPKERKLPVILCREEVDRLLSCVSTFHNHTFFSTVYACGLRLQEALSLQVADIDARRMMVHVHRGKGAKDRNVPLPGETLLLLRKYWTTHRNPSLVFPALGRGHNQGSISTEPMNRSSVQGALTRAAKKAGIHKKISVHTLRHCYATHLLEQGVNIRVIQRYMGHSSLETTMKYLHLTQKGSEDAYRIIDSFMSGFAYERA